MMLCNVLLYVYVLFIFWCLLKIFVIMVWIDGIMSVMFLVSRIVGLWIGLGWKFVIIY